MTNSALLGGGALVLALAWGPWNWVHAGLAGHMLQHLIVMNIAALFFAAALRIRISAGLAIPTVLQIGLLWGWHLPVLFDAAQHDLMLVVLMQASLFAVAFLFWSAVIAHPVERSWQTIFALLATAKALCLFGAILCFARGALYAGHGRETSGAALDDQQLAGLLMMASCALVYVTASIVLLTRWMALLERSAPWARADA